MCPLYEYQCQECGSRYNLLLPVNHKTPVCFNCESVEMRRVLHAPAIQFKGDGWTGKSFVGNTINSDDDPEDL